MCKNCSRRTELIVIRWSGELMMMSEYDNKIYCVARALVNDECKTITWTNFFLARLFFCRSAASTYSKFGLFFDSLQIYFFMISRAVFQTYMHNELSKRVHQFSHYSKMYSSTQITVPIRGILLTNADNSLV